jgi:hypothetical protein
MLIAANRSRFLNDREVSAEVELPHANSPFTILCTTRDAREETSFTLSVFSHDEISLKAMPAPSEAFARSVLALERSEKLKDEQDRADLEAALERRKKRLQQSNQVDA